MPRLPSPIDYQEAIQNPKLCFGDAELKSGSPSLNPIGLPKPATGAFASVYQLNCGTHKYAVRCFLQYHPDQEKRYATISSYLQQRKLPWMVGFDFVRQGIKVRGTWYPILKMEWIDGDPLNIYLQKNLGNSQVIKGLAKRFVDMISDLKHSSIAHGDLQHGNILVVNDTLRLIDYDGMFVPGLEGMGSHELGHRNYQHPARDENDFGPYLDNFSAWVIYVSLAALSTNSTLWNRVNGGDECLLFRLEDFKDPMSSAALESLTNLQDPNIRALASTLRSIIYHSDLARVPSIGESQEKQLGPDVGSSKTSPTPVWLGDYVNQSVAPQPSTRTSGPHHSDDSWILDHIDLDRIDDPLPPVHISIASSFETSFVMFVGLATVFLVVAGVFGLFAPAAVVSSLLFGLASTAFVFGQRFRSLPEHSKKNGITTRFTRLRAEISGFESAIRGINNELDGLPKRETEEINQINLIQQASFQSGKNEIEGIDRDLNTRLASINSQRKAVSLAETNELGDAQGRLQNQFVDSRLSSYGIASASMEGIGPSLKSRLIATGVRTAADFTSFTTQQVWMGHHLNQVTYIVLSRGEQVHVDGIGEKKASALMGWRKDIETQLRKQAPRLPRDQEQRIRSSYDVKRKNLDGQEIAAKEEIVRKKNSVREKHKREQTALENNIFEVREKIVRRRQDLLQQRLEQAKYLSEKRWMLVGIKRELDSYNQVTFVNFLRAVLSRGIWTRKT